jgi:hypothetical protein
MHAGPAWEPDWRDSRRRPPRSARAWLIVLALAALVLAGVWAARRSGPGPAAASAGSRPAPAAKPATAGGTFTLLDGRRQTLVGLRGHPVMVWFIAGGCASCAVSIPTVGQHLAAFRAARVRVLVLGMYGQFGQGRQATAELASFGKAAAGKVFRSPAWTWALASERLTAAFDPSGTPDAYALLDAAGHVVYRNSVPVSTMGALLRHLSSAAR